MKIKLAQVNEIHIIVLETRSSIGNVLLSFFSRKGLGIMEDVVSILDELQNKALKDEKLKQQLLATRTEADPLSAFCKTCRNLGYELYEMELIAAGEEFHAAMKRSTNGGGENSPMIEAEDDFYELFFANLEDH